MFGSKTSKLLSYIDRVSYQGKNVQAFKPRMDDRYSQGFICTHSGLKIPAINISSGYDLIEFVSENDEFIDVIAVDEAFMIYDIAQALLQLYALGKTIVVSSLQLSASGKPFTEIKELLPWATKIEVCPAVCPITGEDAFFTKKKTSSGTEIEVGGSDLYEPMCWQHYEVLRDIYLSKE